MKGDGLFSAFSEGQPTRLNEIGDELCVVNYLKRRTEFRIFILEGVEAVRALGEDFLNVILFEQLDQLEC